MKNLIFKNNYIYLFFLIIFYLFIPFIIFHNEKLFLEFSGLSNVFFKFNENLEILYLINTVLLVIVFLIFDERKKANHSYVFQYDIAKYIHLILVLYIIFEIYNLVKLNTLYFSDETSNLYLKNFFEIKFVDGLSTKIIGYREYIYSMFLGGRQTHIKILIILSIYLFKQNRKQALIGYLLIFFYDFISLSRYNFFSLIVIHFLIYFKLDYLKNNLLKIILILVGIFIFLNIRAYIIKPGHFMNNNEIIMYMLRHFLGEFNSVFISLSIFNYEFKEIFIKIYSQYSIVLYVQDNLNFLLSSFFYQNTDALIDYWSSTKLPLSKYSKFGTTYIISYFFVFIFLLIIYRIINVLMNLFSVKDALFVKITSAYILATSFRSNIVHEIGFIIKLIILILVLDLIFKYLKPIKNK